MKREILFRGKRIDNGELVEGLLMANFDGNYSIQVRNYFDGMEYFTTYKVDPETVVQFIGLLDKNKTKIFEGDPVRILYTDWPSKSDSDERTLHQYLNDIAKVGKIVYDGFQFGIAIHSDRFNEDIVHSPEHGQYGFIEVIVKE